MRRAPKHVTSRRDFMQFAALGTGAAAALPVLGAQSAAPTEAREACTADGPSVWQPGPAEHTDAMPLPHALNLNGAWSVRALPLDAKGPAGYQAFTQAADGQLVAQVPGEIHLDLLRAGRIEEPSVSDNARRSRWPEQHSWWYRTEFELPPDFRKHFRQQLIFGGIDLCGEIFVNGQLAGASRNAFAPVSVDVRDLVREGKNELVVRVTSGMELVPPPPAQDPMAYMTTGNAEIQALYGVRTFDVFRVLRKPAYISYGWDFCDPLPNIGIWRDVYLEGRSRIVIDHLRLDTVIQGETVYLEGEVILENVHPWSDTAAVLELQVAPPARMAIR
jgi:beta-mannosidase